VYICKNLKGDYYGKEETLHIRRKNHHTSGTSGTARKKSHKYIINLKFVVSGEAETGSAGGQPVRNSQTEVNKQGVDKSQLPFLPAYSSHNT